MRSRGRDLFAEHRRRERVRLDELQPLPEDDVAEAIYNANRAGEGAPEWAAASDNVKSWVRRQARAAEQAIRERYERRIVES